MKSLLGKVGIALIGLVIFVYAETWGADWRLYGRDDKRIRYFDTERVTRPTKNNVKVWIKFEYTDKGVIEMVKNYGRKYENLSQQIAEEEINCSEKAWRNLSLTHYSKEGKVIFSGSHEGQWNLIVSDSAGEALYEAVCK